MSRRTKREQEAVVAGRAWCYDGEEPSFGRRLVLECGPNRIVWNGKRWRWAEDAEDPQSYDAWPPYDGDVWWLVD